ncbi:MAG TPA: MarC family protein [bacterium]|nr:MarC family protein [bacterium]
MLGRIITDAVAFFVTVNPIGLVPLFIAVTQGETPRERRAIALRAVIVAAVILVVFIAAGQLLLSALGIGVPSFRIAGGLVLLVISMKMILDERPGPKAEGPGHEAAGPKQDVAVFPVAMPFIAGPGAILTAIVLTDSAKFSLAEQAVTTAVLLAVLALTFVMLLMSDQIRRLLRDTGANVLSRVLGLVLAALSVQIILEGIRATFSLH